MIGGLVTSTLLTLFVVPVVYSLLDDAVAAVRKRFSQGAPSPVAGLPTPVAGD